MDVGFVVEVPMVNNSYSFPSIHPCNLTPTGLLNVRGHSRKRAAICNLCQRGNTFLSCQPCDFDICDGCFWLVGRECSHSSSSSSASSSSFSSSQKLNQEKESFQLIMKEETNCPICFETLRGAVESNCCHNLLCRGCSMDLSCCPFCRSSHFVPRPNLPVQKIVEKMNIFLSDTSLRTQTRKMGRKEQREKEAEERERKKKKEEKERRERQRREEERKRKEEEERKRKEEEERRKKKEEERRRLDERGRVVQFWLRESRHSELQRYTSSPTLEKIFFLEEDHFVVLDNGNCNWTGLGQGRLNSLLRGRGGGHTNKVTILAIHSESCYFVQFEDGKCYWAGLPLSVSTILQKAKEIRDVILGETSSGSLQYVIKTDQADFWQVEGVHESWFPGFKTCSLGPQGQFFIRADNGNVIFSRLTKEQFRKVRFFRDHDKLRNIYFGFHTALAIRASPL